jgi:hypothetical protein
MSLEPNIVLGNLRDAHLRERALTRGYRFLYTAWDENDPRPS